MGCRAGRFGLIDDLYGDAALADTYSFVRRVGMVSNASPDVYARPFGDMFWLAVENAQSGKSLWKRYGLSEMSMRLLCDFLMDNNHIAVQYLRLTA